MGLKQLMSGIKIMLANDDLGNLGRLGNQMFQYAALRGLAQRHAYEYCLPPRSVVATRDPNCVASDITMFECFKIPNAPKRVSNFPKIMESGFGLDQNLWERCPNNISLYGYFQTEKYFKHIEKQIREAFTFVDEISQPTKEAFEENFQDAEVISVHLRRGDYLKYPHHPVQQLEYYSKALSKLPDDIPVMIFSDGIDWCKDQEIFQGDRFIFSEGNNTAVDLFLQTLCTYHVIANSSFSWWGSWLAKSKKTIAPNVWFAGPDSQKDLSDLYCSGWTII
tara:strand:- start:13734 stop:14570 length:837 start_codon:yes stop_codon:yes gene_type:complete